MSVSHFCFVFAFVANKHHHIGIVMRVTSHRKKLQFMNSMHSTGNFFSPYLDVIDIQLL